VGRKTRQAPPAGSLIPTTCSKVELAMLLGMSTRSVTEWDQKGAFTRAQGRGRYQTVASVTGYITMLREQAAGRASTTGNSLADERAQTERIVRQIRERELAKLQGETLTLSEVAESWSLFAQAVKAAMLSIPGKARGTIPHLTAHDGDVLKRMVRDLLLDLGEEVEAAVIGGDARKLTGGD